MDEYSDKKENNEPEEAVNPCPPEWLDNDDNALLRGDAIGDTAYTHRWVLKCLFTITEGLPKYIHHSDAPKELASEKRLEGASTTHSEKNEINHDVSVSKKKEEKESQILELDSEVEDAACQLWDMTVEKDVSFHLLNLEEVDILQLASLIFDESCAPRLTEVMVGVVANLCCVEEGCEKVLKKKKEGNEVLLSALHLLGSTSDVPTLCEVMRLIRLLLWHRTNRTPNTSWASCPLLKLLCQDYYRNAITFLIHNSLSDTLISSLLDLLSSFLFICLPETGLNVASLYSTEEIISGFIDILERKSSLLQKNLDEEQEKILNLAVMCLYAFIDTPGARLIQLSAMSSDSKLESALLSYIEHEGRVESLEDLLEDVCDRVTRVVGLFQLLIPYMKLPSLIMTVGRFMALIHGETRQYSVGRSSIEERVRKSSLDHTDLLLSSECVKEKKIRRVSEEQEKKNEDQNIKYKKQFSNPSIEECGWVSPPAITAMGSESISSTPSLVAANSTPVPSVEEYVNSSNEPEASGVPVSTSDADEDDNVDKERNLLSDLPPNLKELEEVLEDYCYQFLAFWWSSEVKEEKRKEAQEIILDVLDQCHAHEVLFILKAVRLRDPSLVPRLQEQILDSGSHRRLVALLALMYQ